MEEIVLTFPFPVDLNQLSTLVSSAVTSRIRNDSWFPKVCTMDALTDVSQLQRITIQDLPFILGPDQTMTPLSTLLKNSGQNQKGSIP